MNCVWFLLGVVVGQGLVVLAGWIIEVFKTRREETEAELKRAFKNELY